ncbi:uncharacterized [Tachysurus ichikawai]
MDSMLLFFFSSFFSSTVSAIGHFATGLNFEQSRTLQVTQGLLEEYRPVRRAGVKVCWCQSQKFARYQAVYVEQAFYKLLAG